MPAARRLASGRAGGGEGAPTWGRREARWAADKVSGFATSALVALGGVVECARVQLGLMDLDDQSEGVEEFDQLEAKRGGLVDDYAGHVAYDAVGNHAMAAQ